MRTILLVLSISLCLEMSAQQTRHAAYFELGGSAVLPSFNYERRLTDRWSGRLGVSFVEGETVEDTERTFIFPLTASWMSHPQLNHHLELGGGITIATGDSQDLYEIGDDDEKFSRVFGTAIIGYRYQKPEGGFLFRSALTPVVASGEVLPWLGVSFGYVWRRR